ncbi:hypothetical protein C8J57DRAFT_1478326 [Mycena rebaudengoi]|nr:hypothetical protein C8J57DRAFT_1478326 [Mycena rebaudengoi]
MRETRIQITNAETITRTQITNANRFWIITGEIRSRADSNPSDPQTIREQIVGTGGRLTLAALAVPDVRQGRNTPFSSHSQPCRASPRALGDTGLERWSGVDNSERKILGDGRTYTGGPRCARHAAREEHTLLIRLPAVPNEPAGAQRHGIRGIAGRYDQKHIHDTGTAASNTFAHRDGTLRPCMGSRGKSRENNRGREYGAAEHKRREQRKEAKKQ